MKPWLAFVLLFIIALSCEARSKNILPPSAAKALSAPTEVVLYSLEPQDRADSSEPQLHHFKILGQTELDPERTAAAINEFKAAISNWDGIMAMCFDPRQAIRIAANNHTYDFLLCYECHRLYVYQDDKLLRSLGAAGSPDILNGLLKSAGIPLAKTESPEEIAEERKKNEETEARWLAGMPKSLCRFWTKTRNDLSPNLKPLRAALVREYPDPQQRILALFTWYGSGDGPWSGYPSYEDIPQQLLLEFPTAELIAAAERTELSDIQIEGAARCFGGWDFSKDRPDDLKSVPLTLKKRLLEHSLKSTDDDKVERAKGAFEP